MCSNSGPLKKLVSYLAAAVAMFRAHSQAIDHQPGSDTAGSTLKFVTAVEAAKARFGMAALGDALRENDDISALFPNVENLGSRSVRTPRNG